MLNDVLVVGLAIGAWLALGYPVARKLGPLVVWPALAAPPLGLAVLAILTVVLYAWGLRIETAFKVCLGLGAPGIVLAVRDGLRSLLHWSHGAFLLVLATATLLVLLPKWLAPPEFSVFQANFDDQFFYLTQAWKGSLFDYATIQSLDPDMDFDTQLAKGVMGLPIQITARPGAALMLAGIATTIDQPILTTSYAYLGALQLCFFFAALFLLRNVIELSNALSLSLALGVTVGFFLQYAFDTNAWSTLAALPVITLFTGLLILGVAAHSPGKANQATLGILGESGFFWSMLVCTGGIAYIYPEISSLAVAISVPIVVYQYFTSEDHSCFLRRLRLAVMAGVGAIVLCALAWPMTFGFILVQRRVLADASIFVHTVSWFQRYLFGYDNDPSSAFNFAAFWQISFWDYLHQIVSVATSFPAGMLGVYFLQPSADTALGVRIVWKLALFWALACLLGFWLWGLLRPSREFRVWKQRALFVGVLSGLVLVAGLRLSGQIYPAYKALTWLSPLLILAIIGPLLSDPRNPSLIKAVALCYVGTQLCFGGYRSYAAAHDDYGIHYRPPYPLDPTQKRIYRWDYSGLRSALSDCSRVRIDLDDAPLESFVKMVVTDMSIHWSSPHLLWGSGHRQIDDPDCTVTTQGRSIQPNHTIIWLRRDDSLLRFYRGELDRLLLVPNLLPALETQGFTGEALVTGGDARTKGRAAIRVPNNSKAPIKRLTMTIDLEQAAGIHVGVRINGRPILDEVASRNGSGSEWSKTVELPDFGEARWLSVVIASDTRGVPDNAWPLRVRLLALEH